MKEELSHAHHHLIDKIIVMSAFVSGISLLPEVLHVVKTHTPTDMSQVTLSIILLNSIVWLIYGFHCTLKSLLLSSFLTILTSGFLIFSFLMY